MTYHKYNIAKTEEGILAALQHPTPSPACIHVRTIQIDWDSPKFSDIPIYIASEEMVDNEDGTDTHPEVHINANMEYSGPVGPYVYLLADYLTHKTFDPQDAAALLYDLNVGVVEFPEEHGYPGHHAEFGLFLTGGGMDLTWDIAEAYIRLGFLPPAEFAQLPGIAGRGHDGYSPERDQMIMDHCVTTCTEIIAHDRFRLERAARTALAPTKA